MQRDELRPKKLSLDNSTYERIVAAARRNFFANGFRRVTMDDLARELGMSKKTLYEYFPSKTAIVEAAIFDKFRDIDAELERITSECPSDFSGMLHRLLRRRELVQRYLGKLLGEGRAAGIIREDIAAELVIEILLGAVEAIMNPPKMAELDITPKTGFLAIIAVILEGVITEKGRSKL
ncbi:MAG: helix-turn-helix domain-containing protein [Syntrophobacteraceae bacterium]